MKKSLILLVPLVLFSCDFNKQQDDTPIEFSLSASKTNLQLKETTNLSISLEDKKDEERAKFIYASSDETILKPIKFENNVITLAAAKTGNATITVTETSYQTVHSIDFKISLSLSLNEDELYLNEDDTFTLIANVDEVNWDSSDSDVVSVDESGLVTALNKGEATIRATYKFDSSIYAECEVCVISTDLEKTVIQQNYKDYAKYSLFNNYASTPADGEINLLIIPVWFNDSSTYITNDTKKANVHEDIEATYLGTNERVGYRSVKTYYEEESGGKLTINGKVTDWYDTYADSSSYIGSSTDTKALLRSAVSWAKTYQGVNPTDYDCDEDGYMDGVILIYARPDYQVMQEGSNNFWAYCGHDQSKSPSTTDPAAGVYFWASYDFMYANYNDYTIERTGSRYGNGNTYRQILDTETFIHEMGHMFGLYDYYDYTGTYGPAGSYTMQDHNVSTHDPFSYIALNWADPYIPTESCTLSIGDFATTHDVILLTPEWNEYDSAFDEYILLELYSLTGLNEHYKGDWFHGIMLPDEVGIRVWHVDARLIVYNGYGGYSAITTNVEEDNVYKVADNSHAKIENFPTNQRGSFLCANQNMLQLISHVPTKNYGVASRSSHFVVEDLFNEGDSFTMDSYKKQFLDINSGEFYTDDDDDILLNNGKELGWSFKVEKISTNAKGKSTAIITLTKLS